MKYVFKYHCDNCETGIVKCTVIETLRSVSHNYGNCDVCKKSFGMKATSRLKPVKKSDIKQN